MSDKDYKEDLPWYVNKSLTAEEQAEFEKHLQNDEELKRDEQFMASLRKTLQSESVQSPGEMGLQRLKRDINKEQQSKTLSQKSTTKWRAFSIAASLMVVAQMGVILNQIPQDDSFVPLSGEQAEGYVIQIQFKENVTERQIRDLLLTEMGSIISGPSKKGIYRIKLNNKDNAKALQRLKANNNIIDYVEAE